MKRSGPRIVALCCLLGFAACDEPQPRAGTARRAVAVDRHVIDEVAAVVMTAITADGRFDTLLIGTEFTIPLGFDERRGRFTEEALAGTLEDVRSFLPGLQEETVESFESANTPPRVNLDWTLTKLTLVPVTDSLGHARLSEMLAALRAGRILRTAYVVVSEPGFNRARDQALLFYEWFEAPQSGRFEFALLERTPDSTWTITARHVFGNY